MSKDVTLVNRSCHNTTVTCYVEKLCDKFHNFYKNAYKPLIDSTTYFDIEKTASKHIDDEYERGIMSWLGRRYLIKETLVDEDDENDNDNTVWVELAETCYSNWKTILNNDMSLQELIRAMFDTYWQRKQFYDGIVKSQLYQQIKSYKVGRDRTKEERWKLPWLENRFAIYEYVTSIQT